MKHVTLALMVSLLGVGCAAEGDDDPTLGEQQEESNDAIAGKTALDASDLATVGILFKDAAGNGLICTGELIAPKVVLTAGHCVVDMKSGFVFVGKSSAAADHLEEAQITKKYLHPQYTASNDLNAAKNDLGLVVLQKPITKAVPLAINRTPLEKLAAKGTEIKMVGYGATARNGATAQGVGPKRIGFAAVASIGAKEFYVTGAATACGGDSGGPAFVKTAKGWLLVGTESRGDNACKQGTVKERVDAYLPFIDGVVAANK